MSTILILGANGTIGNALTRVLSKCAEHDVWGTMRSRRDLGYFEEEIQHKIVLDIEAENFAAIEHLLRQLKPDIVINCIGLIKQLPLANDPLVVLPINAIFPHRLEKLCTQTHARLVHFSTDCVFDGSKGGYIETDRPDAQDLYGQSKFLGEVTSARSVTLRTSFIGHELHTSNELLEWFLKQTGAINGFSRAIYSGLSTIELSRIVRDLVVPKVNMSGIYHVASNPISKYELLKLIADIYKKQTEIVPDTSIVIDRSLNAHRFNTLTGYTAPTWPDMIKAMHHDIGSRRQ